MFVIYMYTFLVTCEFWLTVIISGFALKYWITALVADSSKIRLWNIKRFFLILECEQIRRKTIVIARFELRLRTMRLCRAGCWRVWLLFSISIMLLLVHVRIYQVLNVTKVTDGIHLFKLFRHVIHTSNNTNAYTKTYSFV